MAGNKKNIQILFEGRDVDCLAGESVLEALERNGEDIASSCRSGTCQSCRLKCDSKQIPEKARSGLSARQRSEDLFLACVCPPQSGMNIQRADALSYTNATVQKIEQVADDIVRLTLECQQQFSFQAGQFVSLRSPDGVTRQYSIASDSAAQALEFHIRLLEKGEMSEWLCGHAEVGAMLQISEPSGACVYYSDHKEKDLVLIGTGTGLAPLYGVVSDALASDHRGQIKLFHGSSAPGGLYLMETLLELSRRYPCFEFYPCVSGEASAPEFFRGRADQIALNTISDWSDVIVYLCGHPEMVKQTKMKVFMAGASHSNIFADPFYAANSASGRQEKQL